jgi:carbonic anhydrase/acetyltransferase-like protein (isoleucine patch superfamily)
MKSQNYLFANIISPTAIIRGDIIGDNCWFHDYVVIQNDATIYSDVMVMAYTLIGAHAVVESHCFFGTKSTLGGNSKVGEQSFIGINATIFDDVNVGNKCIIGACSAVNRNMSNFSLWKRNIIATDVIKQYAPDEIESKLAPNKNVR